MDEKFNLLNSNGGMMTSQHPITQMMHYIESAIHALSEYEIKNVGHMAL